MDQLQTWACLFGPTSAVFGVGVGPRRLTASKGQPPAEEERLCTNHRPADGFGRRGGPLPFDRHLDQEQDTRCAMLAQDSRLFASSLLTVVYSPPTSGVNSKPPSGAHKMANLGLALDTAEAVMFCMIPPFDVLTAQHTHPARARV
jgi:hypothetical protein